MGDDEVRLLAMSLIGFRRQVFDGIQAAERVSRQGGSPDLCDHHDGRPGPGPMRHRGYQPVKWQLGSNGHEDPDRFTRRRHDSLVFFGRSIDEVFRLRALR